VVGVELWVFLWIRKLGFESLPRSLTEWPAQAGLLFAVLQTGMSERAAFAHAADEVPTGLYATALWR
jgi:hypothetical protein